MPPSLQAREERSAWPYRSVTSALANPLTGIGDALVSACQRTETVTYLTPIAAPELVAAVGVVQSQMALG